MDKITNEELLLFKELHEARVTANEVFNQRAFRGVKPNVVDKYAETAHFVYELLQNADDANATEVSITLKSDRLLFKHNGTKHFDITSEADERVGDINSITGIGNSSKENTQNKIGKFGVGFKAVFQYTDTPEIYDDTFKFKIEDLIVPTLIEEDHPERKTGETLFVLPFRNPQKSYNEIKKRLESLRNPILFLRHLKKIIWRIDTNNPISALTIEYSKKLLEKNTYNGINLEKYLLKNANREDCIFLFTRDITLTLENGQKQSYPIYVGFYYDEQNKSLITKNKQNIYCFFPTKETFMTCFISHAPFLLTENRQNIKRDENINTDLLSCIATLATDAVVVLRDYGRKNGNLLINENITEIVPQYENRSYSSDDDMFEEPMINAFKDMLEYEPILLSRNNEYLTVEEAYTTTNAVYELLSKEQFRYLLKNAPKGNSYNSYYDNKSYQNVDFLKWELIMNLDKLSDEFDMFSDIDGYSIANLGYDISAEFMNKQKIEWVTKFYTFLRNEAPKYWKISSQSKNTAHVFRSAPIIKTQRDKWVPPFINTNTPNVFLPIGNNKSFDSEYNFINSEYLKIDMAVKFFNELEIKQPDENDYIRNIVLKKYEESNGKRYEIDDDVLKSDLQIILSYYRKVKDTKDEVSYIKLLKNNLYFLGTDDKLHKPEELYIKSDILESFLGEKAIFFNIQFYKYSIREFKGNIVNDFLIKLGAHTEPFIQQVNYFTRYSLPSRFESSLNEITFYEFIRIEDYDLIGFEDAAHKYNRINKSISILLWNNIIPKYIDKNSARIITRQKRKQYHSVNTIVSTFFYNLTKYRWIYDKNGVLKLPQVLYIEDLSPEYDNNNGVAKLLGISKRTQDLREKYNATEEEQKSFEIGSKVTQEIDEDFSEEEAMEAIRAAKAKKKQEKAKRQETEEEEKKQREEDKVSKETNNNQIFNDNDVNIDDKLKRKWDEKKNRHVNKPHSRTEGEEDPDLDITNPIISSPQNNAPFFVQPGNYSKDENVDDTAKAEKNLKAKDTSAQEQAERAKEQVEILDLLKQTPEYTFKWFKVLMELMHAGQQKITDRRVQIDFSRYDMICSDKIVHLSDPNLPVPKWVSDAEKYSIAAISDGKSIKIEGLIVKTEDDSLDISVESNKQLLKDLKAAKKIRIIATDNTNIIDSLETRFLQLEKEDDFDMNANLPNNIEFIYGPPGTGKTTELVKQVHDILENEKSAKILVLTPTNKAADVVALKMSDDDICDGGLARYGATESLYLIEEIGCLTNRDTTDMEDFHNIVVATAARYAYDFLQPNDTPICDFPWDYIFIDEASMIDILTITFIIYSGENAKKIIISGDPKQIQPVVQNDMPAYNIYDMVKLKGFSDALFNYDRFPVKGLMMQHRSIPVIGNLVSNFAYDGLVDSDPERSPQKPLKLDGLQIRNINFVGFDVVELNDIMGLNVIGQSAFNLYSVIFTYNMIEYTIKQIEKNHPDNEYSIGVVCAYRAQADAINNMLESRPLDTMNCKVSCGTVHSFQGDECDIMFIVLNPPAACTSGSHVNNENIINVAMSRARDYIFFILPNGQQKGFFMKNKIGSVVPFTDRAILTCKQVESVMFKGNENFIYEHTHVTCHMPVNVYCEDNALYEVRMSDEALDIRITI